MVRGPDIVSPAFRTNPRPDPATEHWILESTTLVSEDEPETTCASLRWAVLGKTGPEARTPASVSHRATVEVGGTTKAESPAKATTTPLELRNFPPETAT